MPIRPLQAYVLVGRCEVELGTQADRRLASGRSPLGTAESHLTWSLFSGTGAFILIIPIEMWSGWFSLGVKVAVVWYLIAVLRHPGSKK